jgi:sugar phosphate isomerase/epimerase
MTITYHSIPEGDRIGGRRHFLKAAGALSAGAVLGLALPAAVGAEAPAANRPRQKEVPLMQIGILMGTFGRPTLEATLDAVKACGLDCVQLSMDCAGMPSLPDRIDPEVADRIRREAVARGITIAAVAGTFNMSHPDAEHRRAGLRRLGVLASACRRLGTSKIHICTGTRDRENMWRRHPDNDSPEAWRVMAACVREAVEIAKQTDVILAFEPEVNNVVDSAKKSRRLMDEIGSPHLKVTIDAANLFHAGELARMSEMLDESFALVGKDIVLAHAKDLSHDGDAGHEPAGHGRLDYDRYVSLLHAYGFKGPLLLHGLSESQVSGCVAFLRKRLARLSAAPPQPGGGSK